MKRTMLTLIVASLALSGCDLVAEQVGGQVRTAVVEQCLQVTEGIGIGSELVAPVCECTADTFMEKNSSELAQVDTARVEEIVRTCAAEAGSDAVADTTETTGA
ncbi:hypothetical protein HME9302_01455 [Alteripontixanthobacter maritimus]|uniref:Lipoprotein n=1 Tax=Alteripontixanthobacter maritimus TaxID=2161824 RepID=A0A369Q6C1_9SPHN|nr:hypothetical protein [Alteripontixanthobacter maritimus]RDC60254.1 hypothetical protein HME9302_01455 [Alteripontixanthobacter maritimus]